MQNPTFVMAVWITNESFRLKGCWILYYDAVYIKSHSIPGPSTVCFPRLFSVDFLLGFGCFSAEIWVYFDAAETFDPDHETFFAVPQICKLSKSWSQFSIEKRTFQGWFLHFFSAFAMCNSQRSWHLCSNLLYAPPANCKNNHHFQHRS